MITMRTIWSSAQSNPAFMRRVNGWLTIFWIAMIPISLATGWLRSIVYVLAFWLWPLVSGRWAAGQAARVMGRLVDNADVSLVVDSIREPRADVAEVSRQ